MKYIFTQITGILLLLLCVFANQVNAQVNNSTQDLLLQLENTNDEKKKVDILNQLAETYIASDSIQQGVNFAQQALDIATVSIYRMGSANSLLHLGQAYQKANQYPTSLKHYIQGVQEFEKLKEPRKVANTYEKIGMLLKDWGVHEKSLEYFLKAQDIKSSLAESESEDDALRDLGHSYFLVEDYQNALSTYQKLLALYEKKNEKENTLLPLRKIAEIHDINGEYNQALEYRKNSHKVLEEMGKKEDIALALNNLGYAYQKVNDVDNAINSLEKSLEIKESLGNENQYDGNTASILTNLGILYYNTDNYTSSIKSFEKALSHTNPKKQKQVANIQNLITRVYVETQDFVAAKDVNEKAITVAEGGNHLNELEKAYELQNEIYQGFGDSKKALTAYELYASIKAQVYAENVKNKEDVAKQKGIIQKIEQEQKLALVAKERKEIELSNVRLEAEKKEKELILLKKEKELEKTRSEQAQLAKEKAEQDLKLARQQLLADKKDRELKELQQAQALKELEERRKQGEIEVLRKDKELLEKNNEILEQNEKIKAQQLEEQEAKQFYIYIGGALGVFILIIVLVAFYIKRRDNNKLDKQNKMLHANEKKLMEVNNSLKTAQVKIEQALLAEQNLNKEVQEKNEQLQANEEEMRQNAEELAAINEQLGNTLTNLQETQSQLVQSEKMASLGQLVAGVAHEVNTPLGAIKASIGTISDSLNHSLETLPQLFHKLNDDEIDIFYSLLRRSAVPKGPMTSREERKIRRAMTKDLDEQGIANASEIATVFVDIGVHEEIDEFLPLVKHEESEFILKVAYSIALQQKNSANIELAVKKASKVVFALKSYSRQDHQEEMTKADVRENIETVLTIYHNILKQGIEVHTDFDEVPHIDCYHDELSQVWTNLITNAIHAMNNKGQIDIAIKNLGELVEVTIKDYGPGIPEDIRARIFDPFFTTKKAGEGSGLGLDIVRTIVEEKHKGSISVESNLGEGASFVITLPIVAKSKEQVVKEGSV